MELKLILIGYAIMALVVLLIFWGISANQRLTKELSKKEFIKFFAMDLGIAVIWPVVIIVMVAYLITWIKNN